MVLNSSTAFVERRTEELMGERSINFLRNPGGHGSALKINV